jgi:cytochrome subunit of sulfide dehydrogenase
MGRGLIGAALAAAVLSLPSRPTLAQLADDTSQQQRLRTRTLAASCAQCHGTDGRGSAEPASASAAAPSAVNPLRALAGIDAATLTAQMRAFQRNERPATVMGQIARGYTDAQIADLARYFAGVRP